MDLIIIEFVEFRFSNEKSAHYKLNFVISIGTFIICILIIYNILKVLIFTFQFKN